MKAEIKHPLGDAERLSGAAVDPKTAVADYVRILRSASSSLQYRYRRKALVSLGIFEAWMKQRHGQDAGVEVNEELFEQLRSDLESGQVRTRARNNGHSRRYRRAVISQLNSIVALHNAAYGTHEALLRPLVDGRCRRRFRYYGALTATTRKALAWFELRGARAGTKSRRLMSVATRCAAISDAFVMLRRLELRGLEQVTVSMADGMMASGDPDDPQYRRTVRMMNSVRGLYRACVEEGLLDNNPLEHVAHNTFRGHQRRNFVPPEGVDKLLDLSTVDFEDECQVTDRLVTLLYLDTAVRRNELAALSLDEVVGSKSEYALQLPPEKQKGSGKAPATIPIIYPATQTLLAHYLKTRLRKGRGPERLFLDRKGRPASGVALSRAVSREAERLDLWCYHKVNGKHKRPSPHDLRRTFATANIRPLGLCLEAHEVAARLRDSVATMHAHYVLNNPLISGLRAQEYRRRASVEVDSQKAMECVEVLDRFGVDAGLLEPIRAEIRKLASPSTKAEEANEVGRDAQLREWIPEDDALSMIADEWPAAPGGRQLRNYLRGQDALKRAGRKGKLHYDASVVRGLLTDYYPLGALKDNPNVDNSKLKRAATEPGVIAIGRMRLVKKEVAWNLLSGRNGADKNRSHLQTCKTEPLKPAKQSCDRSKKCS
ncbi:MAG: tyrosine-type recombinase/integrase [Kiritimatiellae bacterium]|nr:tyrosine-type recombinase/integrase [Kiritimatiellia bacterium]